SLDKGIDLILSTAESPNISKQTSIKTGFIKFSPVVKDFLVLAIRRATSAYHLPLLTSKGNQLPTPSLLEEEVFLLPLLSRNSNDEFEKITLSSAFGENVEAELIKTSITLDNDSLNHPMDCLVAITDKLNAEALIPPSFYEALCSINNETNENDIFTESVDSFTPFSNDENDAESVNEIFYVESDSDNLNLNSDYSKMKDEQNNCDSLKMVRAELKLNKGNFLLVEELIYHRDKILNEPVMQLVLPRCRIEKVMKLAHELLYGREARGPLAILKSSWAGEIHLPTNISQSAADYLQEMKIKMEKAAESASLTAAQKQKSYGDYFNKRSSVKNFSIGEQVVLLIPDSSNKIYARWTGPGEIIQHHPPHSYKVKLPDGTIRHVHVNKIRNYHPRTLASGVIFDDDHEFGEIHPTPNLSRSTSERVLHETDLNHLKETEREQVLAILLKHRTLFTSDVKIAKKEYETWEERQIPGHQTTYVFQDLYCGSHYQFYIVAYNAVGKGKPSEVVAGKTSGSAPNPPKRDALLSINSTAVSLHLNTWLGGACPVNFFIVQYKANTQREWILVSNNIVPEQKLLTITDLTPGTWYTILMTAHSEAGPTEAEYVFATLTAFGGKKPTVK
ncbi:retrovirus-related Pol polyprotein from transposon 17.6, partial [Trichonephila clavata]